MSLAAGVGGQVDSVAPGHKALHAIAGVAEADVEVRPHARAAQLLAEQQQRRGADAAAHDGNALVAGGQRGGVKAVTAGACHGQGIASLQRSQLAGALALDLIQKGQCAGLVIKIVHADGAGQNRRGVRCPGAQHIKLARMGFAAGILPLHDQAHDIGCDNFLTQDR